MDCPNYIVLMAVIFGVIFIMQKLSHMDLFTEKRLENIQESIRRLESDLQKLRYK
jgi:hypothetical protein